MIKAGSVVVSMTTVALAMISFTPTIEAVDEAMTMIAK
jgi:hypothetical protein